MQPAIQQWAINLWIGTGVFWVVGWLAVKRAARRQSWSSRLGQAGIAAGGYFLIFDPALRLGPFAWRIAPDLAWVAWMGLAITIAGLALAVWARVTMGKNWSAMVTVKKQHELVRRGPYRIVRHPMYSGIILAALGTVIVFGRASGLFGLVLVFVGFWLKLRLEEQFMTEEFGAQYIQFKQQVRALIPFVI